jgi:hypothetical protein
MRVLRMNKIDETTTEQAYLDGAIGFELRLEEERVVDGAISALLQWLCAIIHRVVADLGEVDGSEAQLGCTHPIVFDLGSEKESDFRRRSDFVSNKNKQNGHEMKEEAYKRDKDRTVIVANAPEGPHS